MGRLQLLPSEGLLQTLTVSGAFHKTGPGYLHLRGGVALGGQIDVAQGILGNGIPAADWSGNMADLNIDAGAYFDLRGGSITIDALSGAGVD